MHLDLLSIPQSGGRYVLHDTVLEQYRGSATTQEKAFSFSSNLRGRELQGTSAVYSQYNSSGSKRGESLSQAIQCSMS